MWPWLLLVALVSLGPTHGQLVSPCAFNSMCSCKSAGEPKVGHQATPLRALESVKDISCVGVPFSKLPELPEGQVTHMDVVNSGLEALDNEALGSAQIESLRLMSNKIQHLGDRTFSGMSEVLKSLDLSYNELDELPFEPLHSLRSLDWLNLHSNQIASISGGGHDWSHMKDSLTNVFLGENDLTELPTARYETHEATPGGGRLVHHQSSLSECRLLAWLNVDSNKIHALEPGSLPPALQTLSASHNLIRRFPAEALDGLGELAWLYLRGNYLEELPEYTFKHRLRLDKLDLGENSLLALPPSLFNGSMTVRDLNLDFNYLRALPAQAFRGTNAGRVYLAMNKLEALDDRAFVGLGHTLEFLDLEHNNLQRVPKALAQLKRLKYLYLPANRIAGVADDAFDAFAGTLRALSLSGNQLAAIPATALRDCRKLAHLNVGYNQIREVRAQDFAGWAAALDTLLLRNNRVGRLGARAFRETPRLRELSLSFNQLAEVADDAFADLGASLESLEISFGLHSEDFPVDFLRPLASLLWLALDNNSFRTIAPAALYAHAHLQYLNLEANRLEELPVGVFHGSVHTRLRDVRLGYNRLRELRGDTFAGLAELQTVVLVGNRLRSVHAHAFRSLPALAAVLASDNRLDAIAPRAFVDLPRLARLDLQHNALRDLSLAAFANVSTDARVPLALNVSCNAIAALYAGDTGDAMHVKTLDASWNRVAEVPVDFLQALAGGLRRVLLGNNRIARLDAHAFGALARLEVLAVDANQVAAIASRAFAGLDSLQLLDLSRNRIDALQMAQFAGLSRLRVVDLSHNRVRSVPRDAFAGTRLERLDLSHNEFVVLPSAALGEVGATLRYLRIAHNQIEHLDSTMFPHAPHLLGLDLAHNRLTILSDNVFTGLGGLLRLDLSANPLRANFKELFHYVQRLRHLSLAETGLTKAPMLPLPNLVSLNLSGNAIEVVSAAAVEGLERLRSLHLRGNNLHAVPSQCWGHLPLLKTLDVSLNPIKIITKESFAGLPRLQHLSVHDLPRLERFDADTLSRLRILTSLRIETWPRIEKYRFRLGSVLSAVPSLRRLAVRLREPALTDQLLGAFNTKLRHLEITGDRLVSIHPDAFEGVEENYELVLEIRGTLLEELPSGLFAKLEQIPHLSLDLRDNRFQSLSSATLYAASANNSSWENVGTKLISGGLVLKGNPWACDCSLVWLGHWLRRWLRETLQIHTVVLEGAQQMQRLAREATCTDPRTGAHTPILDLYAEDLSCHASALSHAAAHGDRAPRTHLLLVAALAAWRAW